jgi:hypothetical protein
MKKKNQIKRNTKMKTDDEKQRRHTTAQLAALTITNAFIFQEELAAVNANVKPLLVTVKETNPILALSKQWQDICDNINYKPIFVLALEVLHNLPQRKETFDALSMMAENVLSVIANRAALRHDLMGRIYHYLLLDAKYLGTYYTSVPSATLLLKCTLQPDKWQIEWNDLEALQKLRVADLASGTGTLLMAAQQSITDNFIHATTDSGQKVTQENLKKLHKAVMEQILHGYDVLSSAIHLTASTLALLAPDVAFHKMHLYCMPMGEQSGGTVALGSIDYLTTDVIQAKLDMMDDSDGQAIQVTGAGDVISDAPLPELDLCVMNPPFVRSVGGNLLFGSLPMNQRAQMQRKLGKLLKRPVRQGGPLLASSTAGLGSVFVAVGDKRLKQGGRMALVLPEALGFGVAWEKTRQLLSNRYVVEMLIVSHDPERWNFSENTKLSEILVVAKKRVQGDSVSDAKTVCVNLWKNTDSIVDAMALADSIQRIQPAEVDGGGTLHGVASLRVGIDKRGEVVHLDWTDLQNQQWYPCSFAQTDLVRVAHFLRRKEAYLPSRGIVGQIPLTRLSTLGTLGPDVRDIKDGFNDVSYVTNYHAFWSHDAQIMTTILTKTNRYLEPLSAARRGRKLKKPLDLWAKSGRLMLAERLRFTSQRLAAVRLDQTALSNSW